MVKRYVKIFLMMIWLVSLSMISVFASEMDELLYQGIKDYDFDMVKKAVDNGADVNYVCGDDKIGYRTPLTLAVSGYKNADNKIVQYLIDKGAKVNQTFSWTGTIPLDKNTTPLMSAIRMHDINTVKTLIKAGADVNQADELGDTPLNEALVQGEFYPEMLEVIKLLVENKADVDIANTKGNTPLMVLANYKFLKSNIQIPAANILLNAKANYKAVNDDNKTALSLAIKADNKNMINLIMEQK